MQEKGPHPLQLGLLLAVGLEGGDLVDQRIEDDFFLWPWLKKVVNGTPVNGKDENPRFAPAL